MSQPPPAQSNSNFLRYFGTFGAVVLITLVCLPFQSQVNPTTIALSYLLVILFSAAFFGRNPALVAAILGALCFNFFFLPPFGTFAIADPQNWIAWAAFIITAVVAGELSTRARRRAEEAERGRQEIETLYRKLQSAFKKASQTEALRQSEKLKSALLDAVTHDLRTPLTSIKAAATSLLDDERAEDFKLDAEGKREFLEIINEETDRLNNFIAGMVEMARVEAGALELRRRWCEIEEIINPALERAEKTLQNYRLAVDIEPRLPAARVDAKALAEVVYTLLDNAAKYSDVGSSIKITARYAPVETIKISVADEGRGVPLEMRERVFDKFFRAGLDAKEKKSVGGLGMGLAIARGIIESHGGRIWITDGERGRGTRVVFTVPVGKDE